MEFTVETGYDYSDYAEIKDLRMQGSVDTTQLCGYYVDIIITLDNDDSYTLTMQTEERTNQLQAYNGYEMEHYGDSDDNYDLLEEAVNSELFDEIMSEAIKAAEVEAKRIYENMVGA